MCRSIAGLLAVLALSVSAARLTANQDDPVKTKLDKAKAAFNAEFAKLERGLDDALEKAETAARKKGDKVALDRIKLERTTLELALVFPKSTPQAISQKLSTARGTLESAYALAVKEYTKASKDDKAAEVQKELEQFKKAGIVPRYYTISNINSGLVLSAAKESADRAVALVQVKNTNKAYQQWSFVTTANPEIFFIKNRASGHFVNLAGALKDGGPLHLWSEDGGDHNYWTPVREGLYFTFKSPTSKNYLSVADASKEADKAVVQKAKSDGKEQVWEVIPVKP